jgi:riboflavin synthase
VNLERSLRLTSLIGGHLVQGHVDAVSRIIAVRPEGDARIYRFALPAGYARYVAAKGSVALDGISLTVVEVKRAWFSVSLLAYTLSHTTLGQKGPGDSVNLEVDMLAKYVERLLRP